MQIDIISSLISLGVLAALMGLWMVLTSFAKGEINAVQLRIWGVSSVMFGMAYGLFAARGVIPLFWSLVIGNALYAFGYCGFGWAIARVFQRAFPFWLVGGAVSSCLVALSISEIVMDNSSWRVLILAALTIVPWTVSYAQCSRQWRDNPVLHIQAMRISFAAMIIVSVTRLVSAGVQGHFGYEGLPTSTSYLFGTFVLLLVPVLLSVGFFLLCAERAQQTIRELADSDPLTGVLNRRAILLLAAGRMASARRRGHPLSVVTLDLDEFKALNDRHGHAAGDLVLNGVTRCMNSIKREEDALGRLGGDEFVVFVPFADTSGAVGLAERFRRAIADEKLVFGDHELRITASFGVATLQEGDGSALDMLHRADRALYVAKRRGGNAVCQHEDQSVAAHKTITRPQLVSKST